MPRRSAPCVWIAFAASLAACAPAATRAPYPSEPVAKGKAPAPTPPRDRPSLGEEKIGTDQADTAAAPAVPPVQPPDPATVVASIDASTPPSRAASLRLTDEGRRFLEASDPANALDRLEQALKIDPSNPHAYYWLAQVHDRRGRPDQALAFADKAVVLFPAGERGWLTQAYTFRASVLERAGRFPEARASYKRAVSVEPGNVAARAGLARLGEHGGTPSR